MDRENFQGIQDNIVRFLSGSLMGFNSNSQEVCFSPGGLFASVGQIGVNLGFPQNPSISVENGGKILGPDLYMKYVSSPEFGFRIVEFPKDIEEEEEWTKKKRKKKGNFKLKIKIGNPSIRRLTSGAIAGAFSRTAVAPLETIRTHLMVGNSGHSVTQVFQSIMATEGWRGLFRGNLVNVIRVAPSKAIELFAYDTVRRNLTEKGENTKIPFLPPPSLVAGAIAGVSSTLSTYPLELLKTRLTVQRGVYDNLVHAFVKIVHEEGPLGLYRGLVPSVMGVIPYAATNYFAYETLRKTYKKAFREDEIGNIATLIIGSMSGVISSTTTFPLEVARKRMQLGVLSGQPVYRNLVHALAYIIEKEGLAGLYKGLGASYMKVIPATGISFMCYEACKRILIEKQDDA